MSSSSTYTTSSSSSSSSSPMSSHSASHMSSPTGGSFSSASSRFEPERTPRRIKGGGRGKSTRVHAEDTAAEVVEVADDLCGCRWGGNACWGIGCSPCCGHGGIEPVPALECLGCWICCGPCSLCSLYSSSVNQNCAIVNHILPVLIIPCLCPFVIRHNVRVGNGHGPSGPKGWIGDICMPILCTLCTFGQILRESPRDSWRWHASLDRLEIFNNDIRILVDQ